MIASQTKSFARNQPGASPKVGMQYSCGGNAGDINLVKNI